MLKETKESKKETLHSLVKAEAESLRIKAKKKELDNLDFNSLKPNDITLCVYGQMTGHCYSDRAGKLINSCAVKVYTTDDTLSDALLGKKLGNSPKKEQRDYYFSPIEVFIYKKENQKNGNNKMLIDYLKGKRKTLRFK